MVLDQVGMLNLALPQRNTNGNGKQRNDHVHDRQGELFKPLGHQSGVIVMLARKHTLRSSSASPRSTRKWTSSKVSQPYCCGSA